MWWRESGKEEFWQSKQAACLFGWWLMAGAGLF
jgi:hypothetical protein